MKEFDIDIYKRVLEIVEKRIKEINKMITSSQKEIERVNEFDSLINKIKENSLYFSTEEFTEMFERLLSDNRLENVDFINELVDSIEYLKFVTSSVQSGKLRSLEDSELKLIDEVVNLLGELKKISNDKKENVRTAYTKSNSELENCLGLYDKLRNGLNGTIHFSNDLDYLLDLVKKSDSSLVYDTLELIRVMSIAIHSNIEKQMSEDDIVEQYEEEKDNEKIDIDLIRDLFAKYGYDFNLFTEKHQNIILTKCNLGRIEKVLETLTSYPEYIFVSKYCHSDEKKLYFIFRYATPEILIYLLNDAKKKDVKLEDIFAIEGVYKKVSKPGDATSISGGEVDEYIQGSYEYYKMNSDYLVSLSNRKGYEVDLFKEILLKAPNVLGLPPLLVKNNLRYFDMYDIPLFKRVNSFLTMNSPTVLESRHFLELADVMIENGLYDYMTHYPSILKEETLLKIVLYEKYRDNLSFNTRGQIQEIRHKRTTYNMEDISLYVNRNNLRILFDGFDLGENFRKVLEDIETFKDNCLCDEIISDFDSKFMDDAHISYIIDGVRVSRPKFVRVWSAIKKCNLVESISFDKLLLYALTYNSYYNDMELDKLKSFVSKFNMGGGNNGFPSKS